eukprot:scaffold15.g4286.t1
MASATMMQSVQRSALATKEARASALLATPARGSAAAFAARPARAGAPARRAALRAAAQAVAAPAAPTAQTKTGSSYQLFTLTTWLLDQERQGNINTELATVISSIALACKQIASLVNRAGISNLTGLAGEQNVQGEDQKKLDVISNEVFGNCLRSSGRTGVIASEEEDTPVAVEETYSGDYVVVFDPLDGSSNIDAGISVGSIFGIYEPSEECRIEDMDDPEAMMNKCILNVCKAGNELLCAGGIYGYPSDTKNKNGKLRLLYECAPMSFLAEQAGGKGSTGTQRVLEIVPEKVHQRVPLFVGSKWEVDYAESWLAGKEGKL